MLRTKKAPSFQTGNYNGAMPYCQPQNHLCLIHSFGIVTPFQHDCYCLGASRLPLEEFETLHCGLLLTISRHADGKCNGSSIRRFEQEGKIPTQRRVLALCRIGLLNANELSSRTQREETHANGVSTLRDRCDCGSSLLPVLQPAETEGRVCRERTHKAGNSSSLKKEPEVQGASSLRTTRQGA